MKMRRQQHRSVARLLAILMLHVEPASAFVGTSWKLTLNFGTLLGNDKSSLTTPPLAMFSTGGGRVAKPGWYSESWAASGSRLVMPLDITFEPHPAQAQEPTLQRAGFSTPRKLTCRSTSFVSMSGETHVPTAGVSWASLPSSSVEKLLIWCVDTSETVCKEDIELPAGRLFFSTRVWNLDEVRNLKKALRAVESAVEGELTTEQTLDGGPLALKSRIENRRALEARRDRLRRGLPPPDAKTIEVPGTPAGPSGLCVAQHGQLSVKRTVRKLVPWKGLTDEPEYGVVGCFSLAPVPSP